MHGNCVESLSVNIEFPGVYVGLFGVVAWFLRE